MDHPEKDEKVRIRRRLDWERNHIELTKAYLEIVKEQKITPTLKSLREKTGLTFNVISRHLKEMDLDKLTLGSSHKLLANNIIMGLASRGAAGDSFAAKLYFQIMFGFTEKSNHDVTSKGKEIRGTPQIIVSNQDIADDLKAVIERQNANGDIPADESFRTEPSSL